MRRLDLILIFLLLAGVAGAQEPERTDFFYFDSLTYSQYNNGDWTGLARSAREAVSLGHDYYYMRMRLGISYYERGLYYLAIPHFRKALEFSQDDPIAIEYVYYCYFLSGRYWLADGVSSDFSASTRRKTGVDTTNKNRFAVDFLYSAFKSEEIVDANDGINPLTTPGTLLIPLDMFYAGIGMNHDVGDGVAVIHNLSLIRRSNSYYTYDGTYAYSGYEQQLTQLQYYFSLLFANKRGLTFSPSLFYINTRYPLLDFSSGYGGGGMQTTAYAYNVSENSFGGGFNLSQHLGLAELSAGALAARLGYRTHLQAGGELYIYPMASNALYLGGGLYFNSNEIMSGYENGNVIKIRAGFSIKNRLFIDYIHLSGDINNYCDSNGAIVYNGINKTERVEKLNLSLLPGSGGTTLWLGARYTGEYTAFIPDGYLYSTSSEDYFNSLSITGGISWTF